MLDIVITIAIDETKYVKTCIKTRAPVVSNINITHGRNHHIHVVNNCILKGT